MSSSLSPVAPALAGALGAIHIMCLAGFFFLRQRAVFAIRVPLVVLTCMSLKLLGFVLVAWAFIDPGCPCVAIVFMFWIEWIANYCSVLRKVVLVFRFEVQAALEKFKEVGGQPLLLNSYIRYRRILRTRGQVLSVLAIIAASGVGFLITMLLFPAEDRQPCLVDNWADNKLALGTLIVSWLNFFPLLLISVWSTSRLHKFPRDNWKIGHESSLTSAIAIIFFVAGIVVQATEPLFDKIVALFLVNGVFLQMLNFAMPLHLHRRTVRQLAQMELRQLTSFAGLLKVASFAEPFEAFLRTEFSSENLSFWKEIDGLTQKYQLLSANGPEASKSDSKSKDDSHSSSRPNLKPSEQLQAVARECVRIGQQYVGDRAPWQINISSTAVEDVEVAIGELVRYLTQTEDEEFVDVELRMRIEEAAQAFVVAQQEVFEGLRKDSYPRFLASPVCNALDQSIDFKLFLAGEKMKQDTVICPSPPRPSKTKSARRPSQETSRPRGLTVDTSSPLSLDPSHSRSNSPRLLLELSHSPSGPMDTSSHSPRGTIDTSSHSPKGLPFDHWNSAAPLSVPPSVISAHESLPSSRVINVATTVFPVSGSWNSEAVSYETT